jgi:hypothetical protein
MMALPDCFCSHVLSRKSGRLQCSSISLEEAATAAFRWRRKEWRLALSRRGETQPSRVVRECMAHRAAFDADAQRGEDPQKGQ